MEITERIHIFVIIIISILLFSINFLLLIYSKSKYIINNRPYLLMISTITIIILCDLHMLKIIFGDKIHHLIYFNLQNISVIICITFYSYRGLIIYLNNNINKIKILRICFLLINILTIFYIIFINTFYYNTKIESNDWPNFPVFFIYSIYLFVFHPFIIYKLKKYDIKKDYIYSFLFLSLGFMFEILNVFYPNIYYYLKNYEIIKRYIYFITTFLTCISYNLFPLIKILNRKDENIENHNNNHVIQKKIINDIEQNKNINENEIRKNIYEKYYIN